MAYWGILWGGSDAMNITRAVITAAARDDRHLPLQQLVDRDRHTKAALAIIVEEAVAAGAHEVAIVVRPGDEADFREAAGAAASRLELIPQTEAAGYGNAILQARRFVDDEPFLHFVGDHLYVSDAAASDEHGGAAATPCACQLVAVAKALVLGWPRRARWAALRCGPPTAYPGRRQRQPGRPGGWRWR